VQSPGEAERRPWSATGQTTKLHQPPHRAHKTTTRRDADAGVRTARSLRTDDSPYRLGLNEMNETGYSLGEEARPLPPLGQPLRPLAGY
jgi:hypothetical protein